MPLIDPNHIIIPPRQRTELSTADLEESIERLGQLQPIVVRNTDEGLLLIAGGRRLQACKNLNRDVEYILLDSPYEFSYKCAELEENIKRVDLPWQDRARAISAIHELYVTNNDSWSFEATGQKLGVSSMVICNNVKVVKYAGKVGGIYNLSSLEQALTTIDRQIDRQVAAYSDEIVHGAQRAFVKKEKMDAKLTPDMGGNRDPHNNGSSNISNVDHAKASPMGDTNADLFIVDALANTTHPIICTSFLDWAPTYSGPKFNFIHCDFPYGVDIGSTHGLWDANQYENNPKVFLDLTDCLTNHFDNFASHSCHVMFWFAAKFYTETLNRLQSLGLEVIIPPIIWYHSDNRGMAPYVKGIMQPKRVYDMAFIASRGGRQLLKHEVPNLYGAPLVSQPIHSTQKPEGMLNHFFSMLVDNTTNFLDPTCGSGSALVAAESLGAKRILGLELNPQFADAANVHINQRRMLRRLSKEVKE